MAKPPRKPAAPKPAKKTAAPPEAVPVEAHTHAKAKRTNIPTRETAGFGDTGIGTAVFARDSDLDPQLVWKGKQFNDALDVPAVPIYVQEKVHPRAIIEDLRTRAKAGGPGPADLFADFNGLDDFTKKLDFYAHDQHWTNRLILGDSLLVMASLAEKERLRGQVQCIYFDPPYGIKFGSNWQVSTRKRDVKDAKAEDLTRQPEQIKAFRDTWELGIHSYLTYLRDRLTAARDLLTESGSVFVQIGDANLHHVRSLLDEVFGMRNFISIITFKKTTNATGEYLPGTTDFIVWYAKDRDHVRYRNVYRNKIVGEAGAAGYSWVEESKGKRRKLTSEEIENPSLLPKNSRVFQLDNLTSQSAGRDKGEGAASWFYVNYDGRTFDPTLKSRWKTNEAGMDRLKWGDRLGVIGNTLRYVRFLDDFPAFPITNIWEDTTVAGFAANKMYVVETSTRVIERCLLLSTNPGDLVLDPTCGSGTTAYVAEQWGRRWISIDTSRVALALARTRLMAARFPYYLLADSPEGRKKFRELGVDTTAAVDQSPSKRPVPETPDVSRGFVYKTVPHVTLKSIANNPDIVEGMTREQINAAIAKHADTETLFDQPYEDKGTVRVCGPFTVESLSPHFEVPDTAQDAPAGAAASAETKPIKNYLQLVLDNLRTAGVTGTTKAQRIQFDRLDSYPGSYIQAEGVTDAGLGVRVSVGPELGTVGDEWIKAAALEAIRGSKPDVLLVCAFAFEASVHQQTADLSKEIQFGKLRILPIRMNPDLAMFGGDAGEELLKKTGKANLFTVFGEPDLDVKKAKDGQVTVTVRGVDVFDPTTGTVRTGGTADIACWFVDTDYDGQSFFVRHAYFCGADEPYEKLKKALRAEIDEGAWAALYGTTSQPFPPPPRGRIAVKVVNHYGDEVLKVLAVK